MTDRSAGARNRRTMTVDAELRHEVIKRALGGHHLHDWLPGGDWKQGRSQANNGGGTMPRGSYWTTAKGIEVWAEEGSWSRQAPDEVIPWTEVRDVVHRGATPELTAAYEEASEAWGAHHEKWRPYERYWDADRPKLTDELREQKYQEWSAVSDGLHRAQDAILDHGFGQEQVQETLFDVPEHEQEEMELGF